MPIGVVKWFDAKKGFGFICGPDDGKDVFVHYSNIEGDGFRSLKDGDSVEYELADTDKGPQAHCVHFVEPSGSSEPS
ncbi:MAG: cold shock domain-containing protein [Planctomycetes bacterium]|nr:cold shock domain-containing protein [Planctomycetota bacterium]